MLIGMERDLHMANGKKGIGSAMCRGGSMLGAQSSPGELHPGAQAERRGTGLFHWLRMREWAITPPHITKEAGVKQREL